MEENDGTTSEADHAAIGTLDHHYASTLRQHFPVRDREGHGMANTRHLPPAKYGWQNRFTDEEYNLVMSGQELRMRNWPVHDLSRTADFRPRVYEHPKVQEIKSREDQHQFLRRMDTIREWAIMNPNAHHSSPNASQILPARAGWQYRMTDEEYNLVMSGQQLRMRTWPARDLSRNAYSDFGPRIHEHPRVQVKFREDQRKFPLRMDTIREGAIMHTNAHQSSPNTRQILPAKYGWQYRMTDEEYNLVMSGQQLRMRTWPVRYSSTNAYSEFRPRVHGHLKAQEVKFREDQRKFLLRMDTRSGGSIVHPNTDHSSNTEQILPERDILQHRVREEEYKLVMGRRQLRMRNWPVRDSRTNAYSDTEPRVCEHPKVQEIKSKEDQHQFLRRRGTRRGGMILYPDDHPFYPSDRQILPARDGRQHRMTDENYILSMGGQRLRMRTWPMRDSNRNAESGVRPRVCENPPKEQEIKFNEGLRRREMVNEGIKDLNDLPIAGTAKKPVPVQEPNPQGLPSVIDGHQIGEASRLRNSNSDAESDVRARILEEPSEDDLMEYNEFWRSGYRRRLTRIIDNYWSLLCTKRKAVRIGSLRLACVLLFIAVILFKILL